MLSSLVAAATRPVRRKTIHVSWERSRAHREAFPDQRTSRARAGETTLPSEPQGEQAGAAKCEHESELEKRIGDDPNRYRPSGKRHELPRRTEQVHQSCEDPAAPSRPPLSALG